MFFPLYIVLAILSSSCKLILTYQFFNRIEKHTQLGFFIVKPTLMELYIILKRENTELIQILILVV